jgi:hypothetical protein
MRCPHLGPIPCLATKIKFVCFFDERVETLSLRFESQLSAHITGSVCIVDTHIILA